LARFELGRRTTADDSELFDIYAEIFGEAQARASRLRWEWQYLQNPANEEGPEIWVAREGGRPQGQMGTMPVHLWWGEREVRASWGMDYFVRREAEGRGLGPLLARAWTRHVDVALAMGLTPPALAVYKRLGFRDVGEIPFYQKVLDPGAVARRRLGPLLGSIAGPVLGLGLWLVGLRWGARASNRRLEVGPLSSFGEEFDALWQRARSSYAMCARRDARYLRWKYRGRADKAYDVLVARRSGQLAGFAVSREEDYRGLRLGWIVDVFAEASDHEAKQVLLESLLAGFKRSGVARVQAFCRNAALARDLRRQGFFRGRSTALFCVNAAPDSAAVFADADRWHVVFGDGDMDR